MTVKKTTVEDLRNFIKGAERVRKADLSQNDIDEINEISRQIEKERKKDDEYSNLPKVARKKSEQSQPLEA